MTPERVNADFGRRVVIETDALPWLASPQAGVERRMLDRIGGEVARATSLVRYAPSSVFPAHAHGLGEEFLVLDGVFSDEHGDYPAGAYVRNPPGSRHAPRTAPGCTILVKLRQMSLAERDRIVIDTRAARWQEGAVPGWSVMELYRDQGERVTLERLEPGATAPRYAGAGIEEMFVVEGGLSDGNDTYGRHAWIRNPPGAARPLSSAGGAVYWVKRGYAPPET
jgi:anti-sigma factor ChrR (cupin superfamily)